jgi:hypothetical protein
VQGLGIPGTSGLDFCSKGAGRVVEETAIEKILQNHFVPQKSAAFEAT